MPISGRALPQHFIQLVSANDWRPIALMFNVSTELREHLLLQRATVTLP